MSAILTVAAGLAVILTLAPRLPSPWDIVVAVSFAVLLFQVWKLAVAAGHSGTVAMGAVVLLVLFAAARYRSKRPEA